ncbi:hypothetical protein CL689_03930 [Candidatus Saccharibacteria bacterium]|nr:hypothetical protein [Candidatus Saccharibacteria bacterium]
MSTTSNARSVGDLLESARIKRSAITPEEQKEAARRILGRIEKAAPYSEIASVEPEEQVFARIRPRTLRERGLFWLSQLGAFAESMLKGRHNKSMAIRAYEMVQSIS